MPNAKQCLEPAPPPLECRIPLRVILGIERLGRRLLATTMVLAAGCGTNPDEVAGPGQIEGPAMAPRPGFYTLVIDQVIDLGKAYPTRASFAHDINASGNVVGFVATLPYPQAMRWNGSSGPGIPVDWPSHQQRSSKAWGINDAGTIVGEFQQLGHARRPFRWTPSGGIQDLGVVGTTLPGTFGPSIGAIARGISNNGLITGTSWLNNGGLVNIAYRSIAGGGFISVPPVSACQPYLGGRGNAINDLGQVAAYLLCLPPYGAARATGTGVSAIGDFIDNTTCCGEAFGINQAGTVVGTTEWQPAPNQGPRRKHAFRWGPSTGLVDLHPPGETTDDSEAHDINSQDLVVGTRRSANGRSWAFVQGGGLPMTRLPQLGSARNGPIGGIANAINDNNTVVGASYTAAGVWHATLWKFHIVFTPT